MNYPPFESLGIAPDYLTIGSCAMHNLHERGYLARALPDMDEPEDEPTTASAPRRLYKSRYVGVTEHRGRWLSAWGKTHKERSGVFPGTPEGEQQAAWARAHALGRDWLEDRPLEQVREAAAPAEPREVRGRGRTKLAGKRIG